MPLRIYNTLSRSLDEFRPLEAGQVRIYGCGPTIYDHAHIGNFRSFMAFDVVRRYLEWRGFGVRAVMNLTDVDDKTIAGAAAKGLSIDEFTTPFGEGVLADAELLGIRPFDSYPRATEFVPEMVAFVERLVEKGHAYVADDGSVYFSIASFPDYGKLARVDPDAIRPGARVSMDDYDKDDVRDFVLWKAAKPVDHEVGAAWESPWGLGRPGWHLECSVMSMAELGDTLDIHLGGEDLVFPHHEDEIAQSEAMTGKPFVRYWMHVKHLILEGQKMSKSLGNTVSVQGLLDEGYEAAAIRYQLMSTAYRSEINFTRTELVAASQGIQRLLDFQDRMREAAVSGEAGESSLAALAESGVSSFEEAMDDDLNTSAALAALFVFVTAANGEMDWLGGRVSASDRDAVLAALESMDRVFGLLELARRDRAVDGETVEWIEGKLAERKAARERRDFAAADVIRDELTERGIVVEDTAQGTRWKQIHGSPKTS